MPQDLTHEEQLIQALLDRPTDPQLAEGDLPLPGPPAGFQPEPKQYGMSPEASQRLFKLFQLVPSIRDKVSSIQSGPTPESIRAFGEGFPSNVGAAYNTESRKVVLNPDMPNELLRTMLTHELGHSVGLGEKEVDPLMGKLESATLKQDKINNARTIGQLWDQGEKRAMRPSGLGDINKKDFIDKVLRRGTYARK